MDTTVYTSGNYKIVEIRDDDFSMECIKGDMYCPVANEDIPLIQLQSEEKALDYKIESEGVYGYQLLVWNPSVGMGWEEVDSCWGFVGKYSSEGHYIVEELIKLAESKTTN